MIVIVTIVTIMYVSEMVIPMMVYWFGTVTDSVAGHVNQEAYDATDAGIMDDVREVPLKANPPKYY